MKLLVVTENNTLSESICTKLKEEDFHCVCPKTFKQAKDETINTNFDCMLLDISNNGMEIFFKERKQILTTPIISITNRQDLEQKLKASRLGAQEDISVPIHFSDLFNKINYVVQKNILDKKNYIDAAGLLIDPKIHTVYFKDKQVQLTKTELNLLLVFVRNPDIVITIDMLDELFGKKVENSLAVQPSFVHHIRRLKRKFLDAGLHCGPKNVYKVGYIWNPILNSSI